jgi:hypothetical protein
MGQRAAAIGVKFWPGSPPASRERVASRLILRFGSLDCITNNLACFENEFDDGGSFIIFCEHHFYVTVSRPFPEEVTDIYDPLPEGVFCCSESIDLGAMVEVLTLGDEDGGDLPRTARPLLERLPHPELDAPPLEQDMLDLAI